MKVRDFYPLNIVERREAIEDYIQKEELLYESQVFHEHGYRGVNYLIRHWENRLGPNIIITAHYDGFGAYDNAGGAIGLIWLTKWLKLYNIGCLQDEFGLVCVFTDGEEKGLLGARHLLAHKIFRETAIHCHLSLDGFGAGTAIGGFANVKEVELRINPEDKTTLTLQAETKVFQEMGKPSLHLFSLPSGELRALVNGQVFPPKWKHIHTCDDTPDRIDEEALPFVIHNLYHMLGSLEFDRQGVFAVKE